MKPITQIKIFNLFGLKPSWKKPARPIGYPAVENLAYLGYPKLYKLHLHFSIEGIKRWQEQQRIKFPPKCCVSYEPAKYQLPLLHQTSWFKKAVPLVLDVPHAEAYHQPPGAMLIAEAPHYFDTFPPLTSKKKNNGLYLHYHHHLASIVLYGKNKNFLEETLRINVEEDGDYYPPWVTFPNSMPWDWKQGTPEYWFHYGWRPFMIHLGTEGYETYLKRWNAPEVWVEHYEISKRYAEDQKDQG